MKLSFASLLVAGLMLAACDTASLETAPESDASMAGKRKVSSTEMLVGFPAGDVGGGVLVPGTFFVPTSESESKVIRTKDFVEFTINTTGLPPGAYTIWMFSVNRPEKCTGSPCPELDLYVRSAETGASAFWVTGGVVEVDGHGYFKARVPKGYYPTDPDQIGWPGEGLQNTMSSEISFVVKYHGLPSSDPVVFYDQTHTLLGSCYEGANAVDLGEPFPGVVFNVQCFDPQYTTHVP